MGNKTAGYENQPEWIRRAFPLFGLILAFILLGFAWYLYSHAPLVIERWIRIIFIAAIGFVFLMSSLFYFIKRELGWKWFMGGFYLIPVLLFLQLILLFLKIVKTLAGTIFSGEIPEPVRMFLENYPSKFDMIILGILLIFGVLQILKRLQR
jgi:predicted membrane channel-forming protein YqfA (hemolysin III family)